MEITYSSTRLPALEDRCQMLEDLAEAMVKAQVLEMAPDKESFPCCVKCGEMSFRAVPGMPGSSGPPSDGPPISEAQAQALIDAGGGEAFRDARGGPGRLRIQNAREISRSKIGHALELAIFQCAAERVRNKGCHVILDHDRSGNVHAYVKYDNGDLKNPQDEAMSENCGCGGSH